MRLEFLRHDGIDRQHDLAPKRLGLVHDVARCVGQVVLGQGFADRLAERGEKGVGHAAADHQLIDFRQQIAEQIELARDLGAAHNGDHRSRRSFQRPRQGFELGLHAAASICRQPVREPFGRGMRAVRGGKRVVDKHVAQRGELRHEGRIVLFLAGMKPRVLEA